MKFLNEDEVQSQAKNPFGKDRAKTILKNKIQNKKMSLEQD